MSALPVSGRGHFQDFRPDSGFGTYANVDRHGHFTLKQLRLPVVNEMHTKSYTGPRLIDITLKTSAKCIILICNPTCQHQTNSFVLAGNGKKDFSDYSNPPKMLYCICRQPEGNR